MSADGCQAFGADSEGVLCLSQFLAAFCCLWDRDWPGPAVCQQPRYAPHAAPFRCPCIRVVTSCCTLTGVWCRLNNSRQLHALRLNCCVQGSLSSPWEGCQMARMYSFLCFLFSALLGGWLVAPFQKPFCTATMCQGTLPPFISACHRRTYERYLSSMPATSAASCK